MSGAGGKDELLLGSIVYFEDLDYSQATVKPRLSGVPVVARMMRNVSGFALLPGRLCTGDATAPNIFIRAKGYSATTAEGPLAVVDEYLPSAGVADQMIFWGIIDGPTQVLTDLAGGANNLVPVGTRLVSLTAATTGATTAGRVAPQDLTGATATLGAQILNVLGRALSAKTTSNTNAFLRANLTKW